MAVAAVSPEIEFTRFLADVREPNTPYLSPSRFAERLQLNIQTVAERAHVHRNTVTRAPESPAVQAYMREVVKVLRAAMDVNGGDIMHAIVWFKNHPLADFDYRTADELVTEGKTNAVVQYLQSIESGATG
jgi:uncharacterized protein (DUF2384 family)